MEHDATVRNAVHAAVKRVMPGKKTGEAIRKFPQDVTKHVGEVALRDARSSKGSHQRKGDDPVGSIDDREEGTQDFSQVEPGIAYGHGQPHTTAADQTALEEAEKLEEEEEKVRQVQEMETLETALPADEPSEGAKKLKRNRMLHEVEELEEKITEETKSESLAYMLGGVKMDLYQLNEKLDMLQEDVEDGVPMDTEVDSNVIYPLSACMRCIFLLSAQYFILYTAVAIWKLFVDVLDLGPDTIAERALRAACDTVFYAPMLCVLFLGAHMRALQITLGKRGPQDWAETAMQVCAWSCLVQTVVTLAIPFFSYTQKRPTLSASSPRPSSINPQYPPREAAGFLTFVRCTSLAGLYIGFTMVCVAVVLMDARSLGAKPPDLWDDPRTAKTEYAPPVSVAMVCTISLTLFFFVVHLAHAALWTCNELIKDGPGDSGSAARKIVVSWEECLRSCASAVNLAPMLCILFIAARMRALQMDPKWGRPQDWAETCFYICTGSVMGQTLLIILAKMLGARGISSAREAGEQTSSSVASSPRYLVPGRASPLQKTVLGLGYMVMAVTYVACGVVMYSVFVIKAKDGGPTPPLSPTMFCVMLHVVLYLSVFLCLFLAQAAVEAAQPSRRGDPITPRRIENLERVLATCKMAENTVKFGPMLAVLFVGARVRALQMSNQKGSPQCWAQDAMYMASGAVVIQLCVVVASGALSNAVEVDEDGTLSTTKIQYLPGRIFLECLKAITFVMLFGGVLTVVASILIIRPEAAQCSKRGFTA